MSIEDDLEPKLDDIRRLAREMYSAYLASLGLRFEDGVIDWDPHSEVPSVGPAEVDVEHERDQWIRFSHDVDVVCAKFRRFYGLEPQDLTVITDKLGGRPGSGQDTVLEDTGSSVPATLNKAWDPWVSRVDGMINEGLWAGDAAIRFREEFLWKFEDVLEQQMAYANILAALSNVYHDSVTQGLNKLRAIADATIAALSGEHGGDSGSFFTIAGLLVDIIGFIPVVGTAADVVGFALDVGSAYDEHWSEDRPPVIVDGPNAPAIIASTWDRLIELDQEFADADDQLKERLTECINSESCFKSHGLELSRPAVADDGGAFAEPTHQVTPGTAQRDWLVTDLVSLYTAGYVHLPAAAERYEHARDKLLSCRLPSGVHMFLPRSATKFESACNNLTGILRQTRNSLTDAGTAITAAATAYDLTDEENAVAVARCREVEPPPPPVYTPPMHLPL